MKTYKICHAEDFSDSLYTSKQIKLNKQLPMEGVEPPPLTTLFKERSANADFPFDQFFIEHERIEDAPGRTGSFNFQNYIHRYPIYAFHMPESKLLFLQGKKKALNDLIRNEEICLNMRPLFIDLNNFQDTIENIQMVWFKFYDGQFSSTSFHGKNIKSVIEQQDLFRRGRISTISFTIKYAGKSHLMMLSTDGTIVLQCTYDDIQEELQLLHHFYNKHLAPFIAEENPMRMQPQEPEWKEQLIEEFEDGLNSQSFQDFY